MSIFDGLDPYRFRRKMQKVHSMKQEMDGEVFISVQSQKFSFIDNLIKVFSPIFKLNWRVNNYVSRREKGIKKRNESIFTDR